MVMFSIIFYCCSLIVLFAFIVSELTLNFAPQESINGLLGKINLYPPRGSFAAQKLWPCYGVPCNSWLRPQPALPDSQLQSTVSLESTNKVGEVWRWTERQTWRTEKQNKDKDKGRLIKTEKKNHSDIHKKIRGTETYRDRKSGCS